MKRLFVIFVLLISAVNLAGPIASAQALRGDQRLMTDMAGRKVVVPKKITRVLGMSPVGTILIYTLSPQLLVGWNYQADAGEKALVTEPYRRLPVLGGWYGKNNSGNLEEIIKAHPDVLISMGDAMGPSVAERVQAQTHIPVFVLSGDLEKLPDAYMKAAELLGNQARAAELAAECRKTLTEITGRIKTVPYAKRRRVYYAEGTTGLETEPGNSMHSEALNFAGAVNVASVPNQQGYGHTPVSMEQVLIWNPDVIIGGYDHTSIPSEFYKKVWTDPAWSRLKAVRNREVYETPQYPFCWIDRPPSVNRIIGIKWLANIFYPDLFHYDIRKETRQFYDTFYHVKLTEAQLDQILLTAVKKPAGKMN